jgi:hypothetical protein
MAINRRRVPVAHIKILARVWRGCKGGTGAIGEPNKSTGPAPGEGGEPWHVREQERFPALTVPLYRVIINL